MWAIRQTDHNNIFFAGQRRQGYFQSETFSGLRAGPEAHIGFLPEVEPIFESRQLCRLDRLDRFAHRRQQEQR
jgi:hypothetical protein